MAHKTNIAAFINAAAQSSDEMVKAYCGLVALELVLKEKVGLVDHNVPSAVDRFGLIHAVDFKFGCRQRITAMANRLRTDLAAIAVQGKDGIGRQAPMESYPYIRYTRWDTDAWGAPETGIGQMTTLRNTVQEIRAYLKTKFDMPL